jgi:hypothetical protein
MHVEPYLGSVLLEKLTGTQITTVYRKLETGGRQDHKPGTGLSARTVRYCHTILRAALQEAVRQRLIATNPADLARPPAARAARAPEVRPWSAQQLTTWQAWAELHQCPDAVA